MPYDSYPLARFHPVLGRVEVKSPEDANKVFQPEHDWFKTPEEADQHRTDREAQLVIHNTRRVMTDKLNEATDAQDDAKREDDSTIEGGTVAHSVTMHERVVVPMGLMDTPEERTAKAEALAEAADKIAESRAEVAADVKVEVVPPVTQDVSA